jgi:hypothetical protein
MYTLKGKARLYSALSSDLLALLDVGIFAFTSFRSRDLMPRDSASPK